jgi:hypothetical protein
MITNQLNAKYDTSYSNSDNTSKLLGRSLIFGQAYGIIGVVLYRPDIPLEESRIYLHIYHILHVKHILHILHISIYTYYIFPLAGHKDCIIIFKSAAYCALTDEELEEILTC